MVRIDGESLPSGKDIVEMPGLDVTRWCASQIVV